MTNREYSESKGIYGWMDVNVDMDAPLEEGFKYFVDATEEYARKLRKREKEMTLEEAIKDLEQKVSQKAALLPGLDKDKSAFTYRHINASKERLESILGFLKELKERRGEEEQHESKRLISSNISVSRYTDRG